MSTMSRLIRALFLTSAIVLPSVAIAQDMPPADPVPAAPAEEEQVEVSIPGGGNEIVVTGARDRNIAKASDQVISVLSSAEIARTGDGNIAGALGRVTGLSVVGSGYVYVRGLGDRYSLALLNGSPLPSPEPLKRVVPLDLFPSSVISSSLVQKSYSVNYPGEFGGGVINLTTKAIPRDGFVTLGGSLSADSETTGQLGYTYYGSNSDWYGYDSGRRRIPPALANFFASGERISSGNVDTGKIASELVNGNNAVLQRWGKLPPNFSASLSAGKAFAVGESELGIIAAAGFSNKWQSREAIQQTSGSDDLTFLNSNFRRVTTDQRTVVNGLLGLGFDTGAHKLRWTNLYIHDTVKQARLGIGKKQETPTDYMQQDTAWFERQLFNSQLVGEFALLPELKLELRGSYARSKRNAPFEMSFEYQRSNSQADPLGDIFTNRLNNGNGGDAEIAFSMLNERLWSGGADLSWVATPEITVTTGGAFTDTYRTSSRRDFKFLAPSTMPGGVGALRPDYLLAPGIIDYFGIEMVETNEGTVAFAAALKTAAGYAKANVQVTPGISIDAGVRYEKAKQRVDPIQVFKVPGASTAGTRLEEGYWLPGATLTWQLRNDLQFRLNASKTIARPQFRELIYQFYFDPESNRMYQGNPLLEDTRLTNGEARLEWYFARDQRISVAGFYKKITKPIEAFVLGGNEFITSYANAPRAKLYGVEAEAQKYFDLGVSDGFFADRRIVTMANYTFTKSRISVKPEDTIRVFAVSSNLATDFFRDGAPLTGQSDHIVNLQLGLEAQSRLSQQTLLVSYASAHAVSRGIANTGQPDIVEKPGLRLDFVAREEVKLAGIPVEFKFEARNLTGQKHEEVQEIGGNRIDVNTYDMGRTVSLSASLKF